MRLAQGGDGDYALVMLILGLKVVLAVGRLAHPVVAVKRFRYVLHLLCLGGCALYALNRWGLKPHTHLALFRF